METFSVGRVVSCIAENNYVYTILCSFVFRLSHSVVLKLMVEREWVGLAGYWRLTLSFLCPATDTWGAMVRGFCHCMIQGCSTWGGSWRERERGHVRPCLDEVGDKDCPCVCEIIVKLETLWKGVVCLCMQRLYRYHIIVQWSVKCTDGPRAFLVAVPWRSGQGGSMNHINSHSYVSLQLLCVCVVY